MAARLLSLAASRKSLVVQLGAFALLLALLGVDLALVKSLTPCATYRRWGAVTDWLGPTLLVVAFSLWLVRAVALLALRRFKPFWLCLGLMVLEAAVLFGAVWLSLDSTPFYCAFDGVSLPPCLFGCAH